MTPWTVACQAPLAMEFSRQEFWSGLPFLSPGDLPDPDIKRTSLGQEDPLEDGVATSILAWKISWIEEPGRLQLMVLQRIRHN